MYNFYFHQNQTTCVEPQLNQWNDSSTSRENKLMMKQILYFYMMKSLKILLLFHFHVKQMWNQGLQLIFYKNILIFILITYNKINILITIFRKYAKYLPFHILWRWLQENVTEISVYFYKMSIGVINSTLEHYVKASRFFAWRYFSFVKNRSVKFQNF